MAELLLVQAPDTVLDVGLYVVKALSDNTTSPFFDECFESLEHRQTLDNIEEYCDDFDRLAVTGLVRDIFSKGYVSKQHEHQLYDALTLTNPLRIPKWLKGFAEMHDLAANSGLVNTAIGTLAASQLVALANSISWQPTPVITDTSGMEISFNNITGGYLFFGESVEAYFEADHPVAIYAKEHGFEDFIWQYKLTWLKTSSRGLWPVAETLPDGNFAAYPVFGTYQATANNSLDFVPIEVLVHPVDRLQLEIDHGFWDDLK